MRFYFKRRAILDALIAFLVVISIFYIPWKRPIFHTLSQSATENLAFCLLATASSLLGFVLAASTFLISHIQSPRFDMLRSAASFRQLPKLVSSSLWRLFFTTIAGGALAFVDTTYILVALPFVTFIVAWTLIALAATLWVVLKIYSIPAS